MAIEVAASRRLFTREEYYRMGEVGILKRSDHVELIKGEIVTMSPMGLRHRAFVFNLTDRPSSGSTLKPGSRSTG